MATSAEPSLGSSFSALAWIRGDAEPWTPALDRLLATPGLDRLYVGVGREQASAALPDDDRVEVLAPAPLSHVLRTLPDLVTTPVLVLTSVVLLPELGIEPALTMMADDARVATVSFLSNAAGHLSFPTRNGPTPYAFEGHDETTLTRLLRTSEPTLLPVPIAAPAGAATLVSRDCLVTAGGSDAEFDGEPAIAVLELALRSARRGLRSVLDPSTYLTRVWEGQHWGPDPSDEPVVRQRLHELHPFYPALHDVERTSDLSPIGLAWTTALAKVRGLRILIDASCLGPIENGTQVQTLALVDALARRDDVRSVGVGIAGPVPRYAQHVLDQPKVSVIPTQDLRFRGVPHADVLHRPFQPIGRLPWGNWRRAADRVVVTLQDLIAYGNGAYHHNAAEWMSYRRAVHGSVAGADGLVVISHDVRSDLDRERLPGVAERTFVVENGTDHLRGDEPETFPVELQARGWAARDFLVVLGANYSHKNRDLAVRTFKLLRDQHPSLGLVLAGVAVAEGSSRVLEAAEIRGTEDVVVLPDVSARERNWLLRHASVCLYPTSAEGFGLVPFEAARFGTPTASTRFGPLAEVLEGLPVVADSFDPAELAACCHRLLSDPALAAEQVTATLANATRYTWDQTAASLVSAYRRLLAQSPR